MTSNSEKAMDVCPALGKQLSLPDFRATILGSDEIKTMVTLAQGRGVVIGDGSLRYFSVWNISIYCLFLLILNLQIFGPLSVSVALLLSRS